MTLSIRICIDVPDLEQGLAFFTSAFDLTVVRRAGDDWAELAGGPCPVDLLRKAEGSAPSAHVAAGRTYARHWTPLHLDFVVDDLDAALARAERAGARLEQPVQRHAWGRLALLADPFGHGLCLLEFSGRGYDMVAD